MQQQTGFSRTLDLTPEKVQAGNQSWWTTNPMTYDWKGNNRAKPYSKEWFAETDRAFVYGSRLFATRQAPFDLIIPLEKLSGKSVLEIGCGMGLHTETMTRAGAHVTAIDLTPTAVQVTTRRLESAGLTAEVFQTDAESLPFENRRFDFVWSWGVIHHSSRTARIVREIARVIRPGGEVRVMVYNREGMTARLAFWRDHVLRGGWMHRSFEETLFDMSDGFSARFYVKEQFEDLFRAFFNDVSSEICGQDADVLPVPSSIRKRLLPFLTPNYLSKSQRRRGSFIFLTARNPIEA